MQQARYDELITRLDRDLYATIRLNTENEECKKEWQRDHKHKGREVIQWIKDKWAAVGKEERLHVLANKLRNHLTDGFESFDLKTVTTWRNEA